MISHHKLLYFVTEDWYFCSHRLALAIAAQKAGYEVVVVTRVNQHAELILSHGLKLIHFELSRSSRNPFIEFGMIWRLLRIMRSGACHSWPRLTRMLLTCFVSGLVRVWM